LDALSSLGINGPFLIAQLFNFFVLFFLLRRFLFKPMVNMLETRKQRIADGLQAAEMARREAEAERAQLQSQIDAERREAMERVAAASKRGETLATEIESSARQDAQKILEDARNEAARERDRIIAEAQDQIAELAMLAAEKVLGRELSSRDSQRAFVNEFLAANGKARN
jgi:F-type H+-transporting ATPase subunit b